VEIKIRYNSPGVPGLLEADGPAWVVQFAEPQVSVAPGQAGVLYRGEEVLGGGTIVSAVP
jgi:tRNA-specific 2-thiouridylase